MNVKQQILATAARPWSPGAPAAQAVLAGLMLTLTLPPFPWTGLLAPAALALFFLALDTSERPGRTAWIFGLTHQAGLLHWLFFLDAAKSIPTRALVPIQAAATILYVSLFYLAMGWTFGRLRRTVPAGLHLVLLPVLWIGMEALRSQGELGFPWCLSGSTLIGTPLLGLGRACGEIGLGAGIALLGAVGLGAWRRREGRGRADVAAGGDPLRYALVHLAAGAGLWWVFLAVGSASWGPLAAPKGKGPSPAAAVRPVAVAAVQPDVALADKWVAARIDSSTIPHETLTRQAAAEGAELVVWSETAVPAYLRFDAELLPWMRALVQETGVFVFTGYPDAERTLTGQVIHFNSSGLFAPDGTLLDQYSKHHLLPIGEAMPFTRFLPFLAGIDVGQAEWSPGASPVPLTVPLKQGEFRFSALICFESIFPELSRRAVRLGSQCLVIITNDGWFGQTAGPRQHAWMARLRAVEGGVPVVRSANNGISFICDQRGRILDSLGLGRRGLVRADVLPGRRDTLFLRSGAWPLLVFMVLWLGTGWWRLRRSGPAAVPGKGPCP